MGTAAGEEEEEEEEVVVVVVEEEEEEEEDDDDDDATLPTSLSTTQSPNRSHTIASTTASLSARFASTVNVFLRARTRVVSTTSPPPSSIWPSRAATRSRSISAGPKW